MDTTKTNTLKKNKNIECVTKKELETFKKIIRTHGQKSLNSFLSTLSKEQLEAYNKFTLERKIQTNTPTQIKEFKNCFLDSLSLKQNKDYKDVLESSNLKKAILKLENILLVNKLIE